MSYLVDPMRIFSPRMWRELLGQLRMCKQNTKATVPLDVVPERRTQRCSPRFLPGGRFWSQVSDTCRQAGRERNVGPRTIRDRTLSSTQLDNYQVAIPLYATASIYFLHVVGSSVSCGGAYLTIAHALLQKHCYLWLRAIISVVFFHMVRAGVSWHKIHDTHACAFAVQTKQSVISFGFCFSAALVKAL